MVFKNSKHLGECWVIYLFIFLKFTHGLIWQRIETFFIRYILENYRNGSNAVVKPN